MVAVGPLRARHEAGVLAYFLRRTGSPELAWDLADETWAAAELSARSAGDSPDCWLFAVARETLCESLRAGRVCDRARRRLGLPFEDPSEADLRRVREVATEERLGVLVGGLQPALREAVMAHVPTREAAALAARLESRRWAGGASAPGTAHGAPLLKRFGIASR